MSTPQLDPNATPAQRARYALHHGTDAYRRARAESRIPKTLPPQPDFLGRVAFRKHWGEAKYQAALAAEARGEVQQ